MNKTTPIKYNWTLWAVSLDRSVAPNSIHPRFLSCGSGSPAAMFFDRADAVGHAEECEAQGFTVSGIVKVQTTIEERSKPSRRGMPAK